MRRRRYKSSRILEEKITQPSFSVNRAILNQLPSREYSVLNHFIIPLKLINYLSHLSTLTTPPRIGRANPRKEIPKAYPYKEHTASLLRRRGQLINKLYCIVLFHLSPPLSNTLSVFENIAKGWGRPGRSLSDTPVPQRPRQGEREVVSRLGVIPEATYAPPILVGNRLQTIIRIMSYHSGTSGHEDHHVTDDTVSVTSSTLTVGESTQVLYEFLGSAARDPPTAEQTVFIQPTTAEEEETDYATPARWPPTGQGRLRADGPFPKHDCGNWDKKKDGGIVTPDKRGKHESVKKYLKTFEIVERTQKHYLGNNLNISKMYSLYLEECNENALKDEEIAKEWLDSQIFNYEYNYAFKSPDNDTWTVQTKGQCLQYYPQKWKDGIVIPILKPGKPSHLVKSYRLITLLDSMSRVVEKAIGKIIYRPGLSTSHLLARLVQDNNMSTVASIPLYRCIKTPQLDVCRRPAYEFMWQAELVVKLLKLRFTLHLCLLIKSYLSDRRIADRFNRTLSDYHNTTTSNIPPFQHLHKRRIGASKHHDYDSIGIHQCRR
ncbi:hypothetical protein NQ318_023529 [Aromia moschata]|uniref:Reverse transcriptase n=1 Tax=Aromia moschata TaxID=1265417 RepID=A0AAV8YR39_9CUCU|nr:hypothetical protein NQ318_023529 [Aromia moschata]